MLSSALALVVSSSSIDLLDKARQALLVPHTAPWKETRITGSAIYYGVKHDYTLLCEPGGRFVQAFKGAVSESFGNDGKTYWERDRSRSVDRLDFEDQDRELALSLVLTSNWVTKESPIKITSDGAVLKLALPSGQVETVSIDMTTGLPTQADFPVSSGDLKIVMSEWRVAGDRRIPMHVEITDGAVTDIVSAETELEAPLNPADFQIPDWKLDDVVFDSGKPSRVEAKKAISGHMLVHPLLNGKDVGWFILDSGAEVTVIDKGVADQLQLPSVGHDQLTGIGGNVDSAFRPLDQLVIGPATLSRMMLNDLDLAPIGRMLGIKLAGVLGSDFLRRSVVAVDFTKSTVDVYSRDTYRLPSGSWLPIRFSSGNPAIEASFEDSPRAWFRFDTGADGTVTFHAPYVRKMKLLDGRETQAAGTGGVGGNVTARLGKLRSFELGGHRFDKPRALFATADHGALAEPYLAGNIGQEFMMPFQVVLDFSGYRIGLVPRS